MDQIKLYKYTTWGLLFLNVAVLAFFLLTKPRPQHHSLRNFQFEVIEILNLNTEQVDVFRKLAEEHNEKMMSINERQQALLPPYFERLSGPSKSIDEDSVLNQFQQLEREKIEVTYQHFKSIKLILETDQLPHFEQLIGKFIDNLLLGGKKSSPPPKDFDE